jgi:hypothetical protein
MAAESAIATPTDWVALTRGYDSTIASSKNQVASLNSTLSDLQNKLSSANQRYSQALQRLRYEPQNYRFIDKKGNLITPVNKNSYSNSSNYAQALALQAQVNSLQSQLANTTKQRNEAQTALDTASSDRANVPTKIAEEQKLISQQKEKAEFDANVLAEDTRLQEKAFSKNAMANQALARMNQAQQTEDLTKARSFVGATKAAGGAYNIQEQRKAGQQSVGAAMSAAPGVSAFAGKAASVAPTNLVAQTANTGALKNLQNKDEGINTAVASRAANAVASANFKLPDTAGVQIGEGKIQQFGGS